MGISRGIFSPRASHNLSPLESPPLINPESPYIEKSIHASHTSFPILAVAIIGSFATALLLVGYYIFSKKCCLNRHETDLLGRFTISRRRRIYYPSIYSQSAESQGVDEALIRSISVFIFKKSDVKDGGERTYLECSVCLNEFQENTKLRYLPNCAHVFHINCIDVWLQNTANCPLCRNSITISSTYPMDQIMILHGTSLHGSGDNFPGRGDNFDVIEIGQQNHKIGTNQELLRISPSPKKLQQPKMLQKKVKKCNLVKSMGDECLDIRKNDKKFYVQPIRRSITMDSAADRQLYLAVQDILQQQRLQSDACISEGRSKRVKRLCFSFGGGRGSNRAVLPVVN